MTIDSDDIELIPINNEIATALPKFYRELRTVVRFYEFEPIDKETIEHINSYIQSRAPGPYKVYLDSKNIIDVKFEFPTEQARTWWFLKWS